MLLDHLDKIFLIIALLAVPNLYYHGEYNVPLLLFSFAIWNTTIHYKAIVLYLIIFSLVADIVCLVFDIIQHQSQAQQSSKPKAIIILRFVCFFLKIIIVVFLLITNAQIRNMMIFQNVTQRFGQKEGEPAEVRSTIPVK